MYRVSANHILENFLLFANKIISPIFALIVCLFFFNNLAFGSDTEKDWIQQSIDLTINTRFAEAESLLYGRIEKGDSTVESWFFLTSMLNSKMTHYENQTDAQAFLEAIKKVRSKIQILDSVENRTDSLAQAKQFFYRGSALGYLAFYQGQNSKWFKALDNGLQSIEDLEKSLALDSTLNDAWLGIGVYQYWRSTRLKYLFWTPFVEDLREQGIANIRKAVKKSSYSRYMAMHQMIYILLNYGAKDEALVYAREVVQKYPQSVFMQWAYAHCWYMRHDYEQAAKAYEELLILLEHSTEQNPNHIISCRARLAEMYYNTGRNERALLEAQKSIKLAQNTKLSKEGHKGVGKAQRILEILGH